MVSNLPKVTRRVFGRSDISHARSASRGDALNQHTVPPPLEKRGNPRHREVENAIRDKNTHLNSGFFDPTAQAVKAPHGRDSSSRQRGASRDADPATTPPKARAQALRNKCKPRVNFFGFRIEKHFAYLSKNHLLHLLTKMMCCLFPIPIQEYCTPTLYRRR